MTNKKKFICSEFCCRLGHKNKITKSYTKIEKFAILTKKKAEIVVAWIQRKTNLVTHCCYERKKLESKIHVKVI